MAIYYHCFDSLFSIKIIRSFVIVLILFANIIPGLLLMELEKALTFT